MSQSVELDNETIRAVCRYFVDWGDLKSLSQLSRTDKRNYKICNIVLEEMVKRLESENPKYLSLNLPLKPELIDEDSGNRVMWDLGSQIDWTTVESPNRIILWGREPFTIYLPYLKGDDIKVDKPVILPAPLSLKSLVNEINTFYRRILTKYHMTPEAVFDIYLQQDYKDSHIYHLDTSD